MLKPKGQIFLMSILILSVVLTAGIVLMAIFIKDLKQSTETSTSVKALYAADGAMEWQLYDTFVAATSSPNNLFTNGASCCSSDLIKNQFQKDTGTGYIQAIGVAGNTRRGIEINF
ncbi:MAG: hypothetical protein ACP5RX_01570 [Minisyncoccia bacterium]